jgi:hypothetical protein
MSTKTEQIVNEIVQVLASAGIRTRSDTDALYSFEDAPAIVVDVGHETPRPVTGAGGYVYWDLAVTLFIGAEGATPKLAPEATRLQAHQALYADRTLGGLAVDLTAAGVDRQIDQDNPALGVTGASYHIQYRQLEGQL